MKKSITFGLAAAIMLAGSVPVLAGGSCGSAKADGAANTGSVVQPASYKDTAKNAAGAEAGTKAKQDIVDLAVSAGSFKTLTAALTAAGLVDVLRGDGPFTVFAPTDEAFAKLPAGTVESLLKPENKEQLVKVLTYHVVPGRLDAGKVAAQKEVGTVQGGKLDIAAKEDGVYLEQAKVVQADLMAANGVVHVIDSVLLPQ